MKVIALIIAVFLVFFFLECSSQNQWSHQELAQLHTLFESRNYFELRDNLRGKLDSNVPIIIFYKAALQSALNNPIKSNSYLDQIVASESIPDSLRAEIWTMKMNNYFRLHSYAKALESADRVLQLPNLPDEKEKDVRNSLRIAMALRDTPPQTIKKSGDSELKLKGTHIVATINGYERDYAYDTGANFSILMQTEAEALNLQIIKADIDVGTATGRRVKADVGVAKTLIIGKMAFHNTVFLIFPDEVLTFPGGFQLKGIIGFPVLEAMEELQFKDGTLFVPQNAPPRGVQNLALENLTPLIHISYKDHSLIGRLDSGAGKTVFYKPFFRDFISNAAATSKIDTIKAGGVGGVVEHPVYRLESITINLADTVITIDSTYVHTTYLGDESDNYLDVNIGLDVLHQFDSFIINFKDMAFIPG